MSKYFWVGLFLCFQFSTAQAHVKTEQSFLDRLNSSLENCRSLNCQNPKDLRRTGIIGDLKPADKSMLEEVMSSFLDLWGDTILEGDFGAKIELASLYSVETIADQDGQLAGYFMTYKVPGWYTGECEINSEADTQDEVYAKCEKILISESAFVSLDGQEADLDYETVGNFESYDWQ